MIKARGTGADGRPALVFGLSFANLDRLRAGDPIEFDASPYGFDGTMMFFAGRDEQTMAAMLRLNSPPGVEEHIEPNAP